MDLQKQVVEMAREDLGNVLLCLNYDIYLICGYTDLRKSVDGLLDLVQLTYGMDIEGKVFLFCGRKADRLKALYKIDDVFFLLYSRYDEGKLQWPRNSEEAWLLSPGQLNSVLNGMKPDRDSITKIVLCN